MARAIQEMYLIAGLTAAAWLRAAAESDGSRHSLATIIDQAPELSAVRTRPDGTTFAVDADDIVQSPDIGRAMLDLRAFMFERVYLGPEAQEQRTHAVGTVRHIFDWLVDHPEDLPANRPGDLPERVTDYVAGMTDRFALAWR